VAVERSKLAPFAATASRSDNAATSGRVKVMSIPLDSE
jgi:hypothetical protein